MYPAAPVVAVGALVFDGDRVLLVQRGHEPSRGTWTVPGGAVELGEDVRGAVAREVLEETGLRVRVGPIVDVVDHIERDAMGVRYQYVILDFLAEVESGTLRAGADAEDVRWVPLDAMPSLNVSPQLPAVVRRARQIVAAGGFLLQS